MHYLVGARCEGARPLSHEVKVFFLSTNCFIYHKVKLTSTKLEVNTRRLHSPSLRPQWEVIQWMFLPNTGRILSGQQFTPFVTNRIFSVVFIGKKMKKKRKVYAEELTPRPVCPAVDAIQAGLSIKMIWESSSNSQAVFHYRLYF